MITETKAYRDPRGKLHDNKQDALLVCIEVSLSDGRQGSDNGVSITPGLAKLVAERAADLAPLLQEWLKLPQDTMTECGPA